MLTGDVIATPNAELPYKGVIHREREVILEQYFKSMLEAEVYVLDTLRGLSALKDGGSGDGMSSPV